MLNVAEKRARLRQLRKAALIAVMIPALLAACAPVPAPAPPPPPPMAPAPPPPPPPAVPMVRG